MALARQSPNEPLRAAGKLFQKARGRQKLLTRYCCFHPAGNHLPLSINGNLRQSFGFASRGRTWRLRAKVRTSHFERLGSSSKSQGADNATDQVLPYPRRGPWQDLALARQSPNEPFRAASEQLQKARGRQKLLTRYCRFLPAGGATAGLGACAPKSERAISSGWGVAPKAKGRTIVRPLAFGATDQIRTGDLLITNQLLYRLSHSSIVI